MRKEINSSARILFDLRSPKEYEQGSIPNSINLPLLDNNERHEIGLTYKTEGQTNAVQMGLECFADKASAFLNQALLYAPNKKIAVYCWRGGMRSSLVAKWMTLCGFDVVLLKGGYKSFRKSVISRIEDLSNHEFIVLNGRTGSGKTQIIERAIAENLPAIDLEGIVKHRGSVFGGMAQKDPSPTQQNFENILANKYLDINTSKIILLELEGNIGPIILPSMLRKKIYSSKMLLIEREFSERISYLKSIYIDRWGDEEKATCYKNVEMLSRYLSAGEKSAIISAVEKNDFETTISMLLKIRYDKTYDKGITRMKDQFIETFNISYQFDEIINFLKKNLEN